MKKKWVIYIKSHADAPDLEDEVEAETKEEAMAVFREHFYGLKEWDDFELLKNIAEVE